jgi:pimeloyl-ACP methyl ester carboxylesterase
LRRTGGWSVNFGNPRALVYGGYILAGLLLGALGLRAEPQYQEGAPPANGRTWGIPLKPCRAVRDHDGMCGKFEVFEDRAARSGRKVSLSLAVLPAKAVNPAPDPVFLLAGGPGQSAIEAFAPTGYLDAFNETRDVVLVDQRGTGGSNRLACKSSTTPSRIPSVGQLRACRAELEKIADLRWYTTSIAMDDLDDVRAALGYDRINLLGGSYGTRAALEYLRRHEDRVRTVILKGVAPMGYKLPLPFARAIQSSLEHLFADCAADSKCGARYPNLRDDFEKVLAGLEQQPVVYRASRSAEDSELTRDALLDVLRPMLYSPQVVSVLPVFIHRAADGDFTGLAAVTHQVVAQLDAQIARGMSLSVICSEDVPFITDDEVARETRGTYMGDANVRRFRETCSVWPHAVVPPSFLEPVKSQRPALLVSGDEDPATPASIAEAAARSLPNSRHVIIKGGTHGTESPCIDKIMAEFVMHGSAQDLDTSCVASIKRPPFVVP